jgi:drug/metabolite transporter (DMT)-like permease
MRKSRREGILSDHQEKSCEDKKYLVDFRAGSREKSGWASCFEPFDATRTFMEHPVHRNWTTNAQAIGWVLLSTGIFSLIFASGKFAGDSVEVFQINFLRMMGGFIGLSIVMLWQGGKISQYRTAKPGTHFLRAMLGTAGSLMAIQSQADMPIVDATALSLLYVVFVLILGMVFFHERIGRRQWWGIVFCCAGAIVIVGSRGAFQQFDSNYALPASFAVGAAFVFAFEGMLIKHLSGHDRPMVLLLHVSVFGMLLLAVPAWLAWKPLSLTTLLIFLALGPIGVFAQYCTIRGYSMADISIVGPVDYSWLIFSSLIGFFFFQEIPTWAVAGGAALIAAGGIVLATVRPAREKQPTLEFQ